MTVVKAVETSSYELSPDQYRRIYEESSSGQGDSAIQKHSKDELLAVHYNNIDLLKNSEPVIREFVLPIAYAPSSVSLDELQKIPFKDLKLESHHRGGFLTGRTIVRPYHCSEVITIIEGDDGDVAKLVLGFEDSLYCGSQYSLPINSTVAIKEPYCKYNGEGDFVIRVDHPSDIAVLRGDDPTMSMIMQFASGSVEITPAQWRNAGDKAYLKKKYSSAVECYTQAIDNSPLGDIIFLKDTYRKRAFANLTAKSFLSAKKDALSSLSETPSDLRAYHCAGLAAYSLGLYTESKTYFESALALNSYDLKSQKELLRATSRIHEQSSGIYDFSSMVQTVISGTIHLDHATYDGSTEVRSAGTHGRGLFSTGFIKKGSLVLCEKAFCLPDLYSENRAEGVVLYNFNSSSRTQRMAQAGLFLRLRDRLFGSAAGASGEKGKFWDLDAGGYVRSGMEGKMVDGVPVVDSFLIEAIRLKNCFSCPRLSLSLLQFHLSSQKTHPQNLQPSHLSTGLWIHASYINHSCLPNLTRSFIGDMMIIRANSDIPPNTELTQQYLAPEAHFLTRRKEFPLHWDFECDCVLCTSEAKSPDEMHVQRRELVEKIKDLALKSGNRNGGASGGCVSSSTIKAIERLTRKLEDLHEPEIYAEIPRLLLVHPSIWLTEAHREKGNHAKVVRYAIKILRNFGFVGVRGVDGSACLDTMGMGTGIVNVESFGALKTASEAYIALGQEELAKKCEDEARGMWEIITGCGVGVEELFKSPV
ncbi:hypothetical protein BKA64DRAFT_173875 [Cadophora sp. MPI-SDFR-AT-0126]|nr:hypothetical protein BKA64DRAFT_173875 [Leotiomycetes sp. MPI-SDFR-AT-0126]